MLYTVIVFSRGEKIKFQSRDREKMIVFLSMAADTVEGFKDGLSYVLLTTEPEPEVIRNDLE